MTRVTDVEVEPAPIIVWPYAAAGPSGGPLLLSLLRTTDHKLIGQMYLVTSFAFFMLGGLLALVMRAELARPGMQFLSPEQYNQLFTMHGTIMLLLFATPLVFAFANLVIPLQIGSPDVAFPRLNAFSYWLFLFGGLTVVSGGFLTPQGAPDFGWTAYTPLSSMQHSRPSARTCGSSGWRSAAWAPSWARSTWSPPDLLRAPGHDHVPDADLHLEHPGHLACWCCWPSRS